MDYVVGRLIFLPPSPVLAGQELTAGQLGQERLEIKEKVQSSVITQCDSSIKTILPNYQDFQVLQDQKNKEIKTIKTPPAIVINSHRSPNQDQKNQVIQNIHISPTSVPVPNECLQSHRTLNSYPSQGQEDKGPSEIVEYPLPLAHNSLTTNPLEEQDKETSCSNSTKSSSLMDVTAIHPVLKSFLIGSVSGTCSTVLFQPLDLLKTRLQSQSPRTFRHGVVGGGGEGVFSLMAHILRHEKLVGLWRGMTPSLTRCVPGVGLYFASIHGLKLAFNIKGEPTALEAVMLGLTGRTFSGVMMIPFTVVKTRYESSVYQYGSIREALGSIYRTEGARGLTCGLIPTLLRDAPFSGLYLMMYTWTKKWVGKDAVESPTFGPYARFSCGVWAGIMASLVTQPADVIKTKMQLYPQKFSSVSQVFVYVYKKYGVRGYFKGYMPRTVRRTLIAAMSWTLYEQLVISMGLK